MSTLQPSAESIAHLGGKLAIYAHGRYVSDLCRKVLTFLDARYTIQVHRTNGTFQTI